MTEQTKASQNHLIPSDYRSLARYSSEFISRGLALAASVLSLSHPGQPRERVFEGHSGAVNYVAFSPDGRQILSASSDGTVRLWNIIAGVEIRRFVGHKGVVTSAAFSSDGHLVLSGGDDKTVCLWQNETGKLLQTFQGHKERILSVGFSESADVAYSASRDDTIRIWDLKRGIEINSIRMPHETASVVFSRNRGTAIVRDEDGSVSLFDLKNGGVICPFENTDDWGSQLAMSSEGRYCILDGIDYPGHVWELDTECEIQKIDWEHFTPSSLNDDWDSSGWSDEELRKYFDQWNAMSIDPIEGCKVEESFGVDDVDFNASDRPTIVPEDEEYTPPNAMALGLSSDKLYAAIARRDLVNVWRVQDGQLTRKCSIHEGTILSLAFSPDCRSLLSGDDTNTLRLWDVDSSQASWGAPDGLSSHILTDASNTLHSDLIPKDSISLADKSSQVIGRRSTFDQNVLATKPIRVLIVDDSPETRKNLRKLLHGQTDIEIVGFAANGVQAIERYDTLLPDVMTIDTHMPFGYNPDVMTIDMQMQAYDDGIVAIAEICKRHPDAKIIVATVHDDADIIRAVMSAGAMKYLPEPCTTEDLQNAIREVAGRVARGS